MAETIEIRGHEVEIDQAPMKSWAAFKLFRAIEESDSVFSKADATFELCRMVSGLGAEELAELCGGESADMDDILGVSLEIIKAATPKN